MIKSIKYFRYVILINYTLNVTSCTSAQYQFTATDCNTYSIMIKKTEQYKNDSVLLNYTVYRWIDSSYGWFGHYNRRNAKNGFYKVHVDDIFYDSSKLKLTAFVYVEYSTDYIDTMYEKVKDAKAHLFDSHTVMGYRDSLNQIWKLFELDEIAMIGLRGGTLSSAKTFHLSSFFNRKEMEERTSGKFFLPCENEFWTNPPFWKKSERVEGYYNFETYMNATPLNKNIRPYCKVTYPDSLLKLYR